jgi:hypothetical protein
MLSTVGFCEVRQLDQRLNPRNDFTEWASFFALKP